MGVATGKRNAETTPPLVLSAPSVSEAQSKDGVLRAIVVVLAACSGNDKARPADPKLDGGDAAIAAAPADAAPAGPVTPPGTVAPYVLATGKDVGTINVRVEWKDAPVSARKSPGRDPCGARRPPFAQVHTLHGVRDAVVWLDQIPRGKAPPAAAPAAITLRDCVLGPAVQVAARADAELRVRNLDERRVAAVIDWVEAPGGEPVTVARAALPVVGHEIAAAMKPWAARVTTDASGDDAAWVIVPPHPYVAVTDEAGATSLADVPAGTYTVRGWLRPGAGQAARAASAEVTVEAGAAVDVVLSIADAP